MLGEISPILKVHEHHDLRLNVLGQVHCLLAIYGDLDGADGEFKGSNAQVEDGSRNVHTIFDLFSTHRYKRCHPEK